MSTGIKHLSARTRHQGLKRQCVHNFLEPRSVIRVLGALAVFSGDAGAGPAAFVILGPLESSVACLDRYRSVCCVAAYFEGPRDLVGI